MDAQGVNAVRMLFLNRKIAWTVLGGQFRLSRGIGSK
jgi:hypothetical protein